MTFVGGVRSGDKLDEKSDEELKTLVVEQLGEILGVSPANLIFPTSNAGKKAIPQYRVGYEKVTEQIADFEKQNAGIYFCSNFYRGISMSDCVKNAFETANAINEKWKNGKWKMIIFSKSLILQINGLT